MKPTNSRNQARFESLEPRTHLAAHAAMLETVLESSLQVGDAGFGGGRGSAEHVALQPMMQTRVQGNLTARDVDMFRVELTKGQYLNTNLELDKTRLTLYDADANLKAKMYGGNALYSVRESGTYYLRLTDLSGSAAARPYTLNIRPIGLSSDTVASGFMQSDADGLYATREGGTMHITGPTGHGFSLVGNWTQRTRGSGDDTRTVFTVTESLTLRSVAGDIRMPIPENASVRITLEPHRWARYFGEIESIDLGMQIGPMDVAAPFGRTWGMVFNNDVAGANLGGGGWGIRLGSDPLLKDTDLPLNPAVPYLFYTDNKGFSANFGGVEANVAGSYGYSVVVDPADAFFLGAKGIPVVGDVAFGMSYAGNIPFEPNATPSAWGSNDTMFGNVYVKAGLDISAFNPTIPVNIDGDVVIDLDANNDGRNLGGLKANISRMLADGFSERALGNAMGRVFGDVQIGVNGRINLGYEKAGFELSVPVGEGSLIYSGTKQGLFARGRSVNPFAGTPLAPLGGRNSLNIDGYAHRSGTFRLRADGVYNPGLYRMTGTVTLDNNGVRTNGRLRALGTNVNLSGSVLADGRFTLTGSARVNLPLLSGSASFSLRNTNRAVSFGASMNASLSTTIAGVSVGGKVSASFAFGANSSGLTYSGSGKAVLFAGPIEIGPAVKITNRELGIGINAKPILESYVRIPLPA